VVAFPKPLLMVRFLPTLVRAISLKSNPRPLLIARLPPMVLAAEAIPAILVVLSPSPLLMVILPPTFRLPSAVLSLPAPLVMPRFGKPLTLGAAVPLMLLMVLSPAPPLMVKSSGKSIVFDQSKITLSSPAPMLIVTLPVMLLNVTAAPAAPPLMLVVASGVSVSWPTAG